MSKQPPQYFDSNCIRRSLFNSPTRHHEPQHILVNLRFMSKTSSIVSLCPLSTVSTSRLSAMIHVPQQLTIFRSFWLWDQIKNRLHLSCSFDPSYDSFRFIQLCIINKEFLEFFDRILSSIK